jgi:hypothetical protein
MIVPTQGRPGSELVEKRAGIQLTDRDGEETDEQHYLNPGLRL